MFAAGDFVYYVPYTNGTAHGCVVRVNTSDFSLSGVEWFDLAAVNSSLKGYAGGFAAGDFAYYAPSTDGIVNHGLAVRINVSNFSSSGVEWFNMASVSGGLKGYVGGFVAGEFAYYVPSRNGIFHGRVVRVNTSDFSPSGVDWFDLASVSGGLTGFYAGFASGDFAYYVPDAAAHGRVARVNMSNFSSSGVDWFDLATTVDATLKGFSGGFVIGDFAYYVPYYDTVGVHGRIVRIRTSDFSSSGVEWLNLATTVNDGLAGFLGGFVDNGFIYLVPFGGPAIFMGRVVRIRVS